MSNKDMELLASLRLLHYEALQVMSACENYGGDYHSVDYRIDDMLKAIEMYKEKRGE